MQCPDSAGITHPARTDHGGVTQLGQSAGLSIREPRVRIPSSPLCPRSSARESIVLTRRRPVVQVHLGTRMSRARSTTGPCTRLRIERVEVRILSGALVARHTSQQTTHPGPASLARSGSARTGGLCTAGVLGSPVLCHPGRLAQWESSAFTPRRLKVRALRRPPGRDPSG